MAGEKADLTKVEPSNTINISYEDLPEEERQKFMVDQKWQNEEINAKMLACYGKTRQGVIVSHPGIFEFQDVIEIKNKKTIFS